MRHFILIAALSICPTLAWAQMDTDDLTLALQDAGHISVDSVSRANPAVVFGFGNVRLTFVPGTSGTAQTAAQSFVTSFDWGEVAKTQRALVRLRAVAANAINLSDADAKLARAIAAVLADELNLHALKINAILDAVDAATSLADLKTRIAAIPDYPQRTLAQIKTAIQNKLTSGAVD